MHTSSLIFENTCYHLIDILISVFLFVACTEAAGEFCKDIDENACKLLLGTRNDMCQDSCFADVCRKTCNMCRKSIVNLLKYFLQEFFGALFGGQKLNCDFKNVLKSILSLSFSLPLSLSLFLLTTYSMV